MLPAATLSTVQVPHRDFQNLGFLFWEMGMVVPKKFGQIILRRILLWDGVSTPKSDTRVLRFTHSNLCWGRAIKKILIPSE